MAYLFLILGGISGCIGSLLLKQYQRKTATNLKATIMFMLIYSLIITILMGTIALIVEGGWQAFSNIDGIAFSLAIAFAFAVTSTTIICIIGAGYGSMPIMNMFARIGTLVLSLIYGLIFDANNNKLNVFKITGFIVVATIITLSFIDFSKIRASKKNDNFQETNGQSIIQQTAQITASKKNNWIFRILCVVIFFTNGIALVIYRMTTQFRPQINNFSFISLYSLLSIPLCFIVLFVIFFFSRYKQDNKLFIKQDKLCILIIVLYSIFFAAGELLALINTTKIPIIVQAPLSFTVSLVLVALMDKLFYKSKTSVVEWLQFVLSITCSIFFAL